jgi:hypothetical protein
MGENKNGESQRNTRNRFHNFSFLLVLMSLKVCQAAQFLSSGPFSLVVTLLQLRATPKQNALLMYLIAQWRCHNWTLWQSNPTH